MAGTAAQSGRYGRSFGDGEPTDCTGKAAGTTINHPRGVQAKRRPSPCTAFMDFESTAMGVRSADFAANKAGGGADVHQDNVSGCAGCGAARREQTNQRNLRAAGTAYFII